jgi:hypothetical protein
MIRRVNLHCMLGFHLLKEYLELKKLMDVWKDPKIDLFYSSNLSSFQRMLGISRIMLLSANLSAFVFPYLF